MLDSDRLSLKKIEGCCFRVKRGCNILFEQVIVARMHARSDCANTQSVC